MSEQLTSYESISLPAGADLSANEYKGHKVNASGQLVVAGAGEDCLGSLVAGGTSALPSAAGQNGTVAVRGLGVPFAAGAAIATPGAVQLDATGRVIALAAGVKIGFCYEVAAAAGDIVSVVR